MHFILERHADRGVKAVGVWIEQRAIVESCVFLAGFLPLALTELGLIDEYEFVVHPRLAGHGPMVFAGLSKRVDLRLMSRLESGSRAVAMRYEPRK